MLPSSMSALAQKALFFITNIDQRIGESTFGRVFRLTGSGHAKEHRNAKFSTEIIGGITTFCAMAYIISVNASIIADSGGPCVCKDQVDRTCNTDVDYNICLMEVRRDLITGTAALSGLASLVFGFLTNLPIALAPGMGMNAYFAYQVVGYHGTGNISYGTALAAVFVEGLIFIALSLLGMRTWLVRIMPSSLKEATAAGIGLFIAFIGLSNTGLGLVTANTATVPLDLAGCPTQYADPVTGACSSHKLQSPALWLGIFLGGFLTVWLMAFKFKYAIITGIAVVSIISWPRPTSVTYFPHTEIGDARFEFFKTVVGFHPISRTLNAIEWNVVGDAGSFAVALITFLYVDILDCTGTMFSMARFAGQLSEDGEFPQATIAFCTDGFFCMVGALFGSSPVTAYIESSTGIQAGGRTGLTAITTGTCFLVSIFFAPIFASIPPWATGGTLVIVGCTLMRTITRINWNYIGDVIPSFIMIIFMAFSYSIAYGLIAGIMSWVVLNSLIALTTYITGWQPENYREREVWKIRTGKAPWFIRGPSYVISKIRGLPTAGATQHKHTKSSRANHASMQSDEEAIDLSSQDLKHREVIVNERRAGASLERSHSTRAPSTRSGSVPAIPSRAHARLTKDGNGVGDIHQISRMARGA